MIEVTSLSERHIASLKCAQCANYLSISPVSIDKKSGAYQCGRCHRNQNGPRDTVTATVCETLLNFIIFPCCYETNGCGKKFLFNGGNRQHEKVCDFRPMPACPVPACPQSEILLKNLQKHFESHHKDAMIFERVFEIFNKNTPQETLLVNLTEENLCLILKLNVENPNEGVINLKNIKNTDPVSYKIKATCITNSKNILVLDQIDVIDFKSIRTVLQSDRLKFHIEIAATINNSLVSNNNNNPPIKDVSNNRRRRNSLLTELECFVCNEFMFGPIFSCRIGHNLCQPCKSKITKCPICRSPYEGTRNFALESLSQILEYPCKNQSEGCNYYGSHDMIRHHEMACNSKMITCPIRHECNWSGPLETVCDHIVTTCHNFNKFFKMGDLICFKGLNCNNNDVFILNLDSFREIFKVEVKVVGLDSFISWGVAHLGLEEVPKYRFTIEFIDVYGTGRKLTVDGLCHGGVGCEIDLEHFLHVPSSLLEPFFVDGNRKLCYKMNIKNLADI